MLPSDGAPRHAATEYRMNPMSMDKDIKTALLGIVAIAVFLAAAVVAVTPG